MYGYASAAFVLLMTVACQEKDKQDQESGAVCAANKPGFGNDRPATRTPAIPHIYPLTVQKRHAHAVGWFAGCSDFILILFASWRQETPGPSHMQKQLTSPAVLDVIKAR